MQPLFVRLFVEESGQDLIEYGLVAACIATVGILAWSAIRTELGSKYVGWDTAIQNEWHPDDPITP